jgi:glycine cleavage system H protein
VQVDGCDVPEDRLYEFDTDVWLRSDPDGLATIGITQALASFAGRFQTVTFRDLAGPTERGRSVATLESVRFTGPVRLPVEATVVDRNAALLGRPKLLNDAPFTDGWVVRVRAARPGEAERLLETADRIRERLAARLRERRIRCLPAAPDVEMYEIGSECAAVLSRLTEEIGRRAPGEVVLLVTDDPTSPIELVRWSDQTGHSVLAHRVDDGLHRFLLRREPVPRPRRR